MALHGLEPQKSHQLCSKACLDAGFGGQAGGDCPGLGLLFTLLLC